jgi:hypothetical protein
MTNTMHTDSFISIATSKQVVSRAARIAIIVGSILAIINHGDALIPWDLNTEKLIKILLTYLVPYCVSSYSSVRAIQAQKSQAVA